MSYIGTPGFLARTRALAATKSMQSSNVAPSLRSRLRRSNNATYMRKARRIPDIVVEDLSLTTNEYSDDGSRFLITPVDTPVQSHPWRTGYEASSLWLDDRTLVSTPRVMRKASAPVPDAKCLDPSLDSYPKSPPIGSYDLSSLLEDISVISPPPATLLEDIEAVRVNINNDAIPAERRPLPFVLAPPAPPPDSISARIQTYDAPHRLRRRDARRNLHRLYVQGTYPHAFNSRLDPPSQCEPHSLEYQLTLSVLRELDRRTPIASLKSSRQARTSSRLSETLGGVPKHLGFPTTIVRT